MKKSKIQVEGLSIKILQQKEQDFISLTDIAKKVDRRSEIVIQNWIRNAGTLDFLEAWEKGFSVHEIAELADVSVERVESIIQELNEKKTEE